MISHPINSLLTRSDPLLILSDEGSLFLGVLEWD